MKGYYKMNKNKFIREFSQLLEKYKLDKIIGFSSIKLAICIYNMLESIYDLPTKDRVI